MAAITPVATAAGVVRDDWSFKRTAALQATTGQTDWFDVPAKARYCTVFFSLTAVAGTTPTTTLSILAASPAVRDDGQIINVAEHAGLTAMTGAAQLVIDIGPGVTGIANDVTNAAAADSYVSLNVVLPELMGFKVLNDRADADETYSYNLSVRFRP